MTMSDRICLMRGGAIEQIGTPDDLYFRPCTAFVADFVGESNLFAATVRAVDGDAISVAWRDMPGGGSGIGNGAALAVGDAVRVMVRPQNIAVTHPDASAPAPGTDALNAIDTRLLDFFVAGDVSNYRLALTDDAARPNAARPILATTLTRFKRPRHAPGERVVARWHADDAVVIPVSAADA